MYSYLCVWNVSKAVIEKSYQKFKERRQSLKEEKAATTIQTKFRVGSFLLFFFFFVELILFYFPHPFFCSLSIK